MHVVIVDSGIGGLSVFANLCQYLKYATPHAVTKLSFANASPEDMYGYNSMSSMRERLETFDRFLARITQLAQPDLIYLACNTLSVILPHTRFIPKNRVPILDIVQTGISHLQRRLSTNNRQIVILATPTTIEKGTHRRMLVEYGIEPSRFKSIACPGLADAIASDPDGENIARLLGKFVSSNDFSARPFVYLGCTHYGYREDLIDQAFRSQGVEAEILNPNTFALDDLKSFLQAGEHPAQTSMPKLRVLYRYSIPLETVQALQRYLVPVSPEAFLALESYCHMPDLF